MQIASSQAPKTTPSTLAIGLGTPNDSRPLPVARRSRSLVYAASMSTEDSAMRRTRKDAAHALVSSGLGGSRHDVDRALTMLPPASRRFNFSRSCVYVFAG